MYLRIIKYLGLACLLPACAGGFVQQHREFEPQTQVSPANGFENGVLYNLLVGEFAGQQRQMDIAAKYYLKAAEQSDDPAVADRATRIVLFSKNSEMALQAARRWNELAPDDSNAVQAMAVAHLHLRQVDEAMPYLERILDDLSGPYPRQSDRGYVVLGQLLQREANVDDALEVYERLFQQYPDDIRLLLWEARIAVTANKHDRALESIERVIAADKEFVDAYLVKARILATQGKERQAMEAVAEALERKPDDHSLRFQYARMLAQDQRGEEALQNLLIVNQAQPRNDEVLFTMGLLYLELKSFAEAEATFRRLLELDMRVSESHFYLGRMYEEQGQPEKAMEEYSKVTENNEFMFNAQISMAALIAKQGDVEKAIERFRELEVELADWEERDRIYLIEGSVLREVGRLEASFDAFTRGLEVFPENKNLLYARALAAEALDRLDITESDLLRLLELEPDNPAALNALGYTLADRTDRFEEAEEYITRAHELDPEDSAIHDSLGWLYYRLGDYEKSLKWLRRAYSALPDPEVAAHLGEVLWVTGEREEAERIWRENLKAHPEHPVLLRTLKRFIP